MGWKYLRRIFRKSQNLLNNHPGNAKAVAVPYGNNAAAGKYFDTGDANCTTKCMEKVTRSYASRRSITAISRIRIPDTRAAEKSPGDCLATRGHGKSENRQATVHLQAKSRRCV
jgi:hypothetical protein